MSLLQPQLPSWLRAKVPPPVITLDVEPPLVATEDSLPMSWAKRKRRITRLLLRDERKEANLLHRVDRIVALLEICKCPKCGRLRLHVRDDGRQECHYASCLYLQFLLPPGQTWEPRPKSELYPDLVVVPLISRYPTKAYLLHLVSKYGYDLAAALSTFPCRYYRNPDEKHKPQPLPEATRENLMKALSRRRYKDPNMRLAVKSVIGGAAAGKVANRYRVDEGELKRNVRQIEKTLEAQEA